jgi:excisionase family DNA binding protein
MAEDDTKTQDAAAAQPIAAMPEAPQRLPRKKIRSIKRATLTPREVAEITGYGIGRVYRMLRDGVIPHLPIEPGGKGFLVPRHALEEWMNSCGQK